MKNQNVSDEVSKTLQVATEIDQLQAPPFFYTRLRARMEVQLQEEKYFKWLLKPALIIPTFILVIGLNLYTMSSLSKLPSTQDHFNKSYNLNTSDDINFY